jgi:hypothetical protein
LRDRMKSLQFEDPFKELRDRMKSLQFEDPFKELRDRMKSLQFEDPFKELQDRMKSLQFEGPFKELRDRMKSLQFENPFKEIRKTLSRYHDLTNVYRNIFSYSVPANSFEEAYQEVFSKFVTEQQHSGGDAAEAAIHVAEEINYQAKTFQPSKLSLEFYLNFIIAFIFFLYSMHLSKQSELKITELIRATQSIIIERLNEFNEQDKKETYYLVQRAVNLRTKPTTKNSDVINVLYPNQIVRLVERKGKWIKVEYYNHILDIHENGWCYKKYLKINK